VLLISGGGIGSREGCVQRLASNLLALLLALGGIVPAAATGEFSSGRWAGQALFEGARFTHCAMLAPYVSRWKLVFSVDRNGEVGLGLQSEIVQMYPWQKARIWMQIDNEPVVTPVFRTASMTFVVTKFPADSDWIKRLRKGKKLKVNVGKRVPNFDLAGLDEAFTALYACARKNGTA
jgi:hypothetical protein